MKGRAGVLQQSGPANSRPILRSKAFHFGEWLVDAESCTLTHDVERSTVQVEPRVMDVLVVLCSRASEILSAEDLLRLCWDRVVVGENQVHKAITQLRRLLKDSAGQSRYIENIRKRGYRTVAPVKELPSVRAHDMTDRWARESPFVGLDPFSESHAAVFFGRDEAAARLLDVAVARVRAERAFILVLGASGSGKTSLIQAGLLPALKHSQHEIQLLASTTLDLGDIGAMPLLTALGSALLDLEVDNVPLLTDQSAEDIGAALSESVPAMLHTALRRNTPEADSPRIAVFVDRLEALFNSPMVSDRDRNQFLVGLDALACSGAVIVIAACRNDFYPDIAREPLLMKGKADGAHFDLGHPTRAQIAQMIRGPAAVAELSFGTDPGTKAHLDDMLCEGTADNPDALPLLQYTLHELYLQRDNNRELTVEAYRALGGIEGAIGKRAEATLHSLAARSQSCLPRILSMIITVTDETVRGRRIPWSALTDNTERALVRTFVEERLFVSFVYEGESVFGVAHEAMLRQWPRVAAWISDHRQALHTRSRLEGAARRWALEGKRHDLLLPRGKQLEEARELVGHPAGIPLNSEVTALIAASVQKVKHADQRRVGALIGFAAIALAAIVLGLQAHRAQLNADHHRHEAEDLMNFMLGDLADKLRPLGRLDLLAGIGRKALGYFSMTQPVSLTANERGQQAKALQTIAEVARSRADTAGAVRALLLAKSLLDSNLAQGAQSPGLLKDLGADAFWLGQIDFDQGRLDAAEKWLQQYRSYSLRMMQRDPQDVDAWIEVSYADNSLGSVAQARGDKSTAAELFQHSLDLKRRALIRRPDDRVLLAELADSLSWLGSARESIGELHQALAIYEQEQAEIQVLRAAAPSELKWTQRLVGSLRRHGVLLLATGNGTAATAKLRQSIELAEHLTQQDPSNRVWQREWLNSRVTAAQAYSDTGDLPQALQLQTSAAAALANLTRLDPNNQSWMLLESGNRIHRAETLLRLGRALEADGSLQQALLPMRVAAAHSPQGDNTELNQKIALGLLDLADVQGALGESVAASRACREAGDILRPMQQTPSPHYYTQDLWVRVELCQGHREASAVTQQWLAQIGYRRNDYVRLLAKQTH